MRVYRYKQLKLEVSLVAGGDLLADTKYYVFGAIWNNSSLLTNNHDWFVISAPASEVYEITTNSTDKSIKLDIYFDGDLDITDAGSGKLNVYSPIHCLDAGNQIVISGTSDYDGTYTIDDWIDYNNFTITATYVSDQSGTWRANNFVNGLTRWVGWCATIDPRDANGDFIGTTDYMNKYTHGPGGNQSLNVNTYTITAQPTSVRFSPPSTWNLKPKKPFKFFTDIGFPALRGTETSVTITQIQDELDNAGLGDYNSFPEFNSINIRFPNATIALNGRLILTLNTDFRFNEATALRSLFTNINPFTLALSAPYARDYTGFTLESTDGTAAFFGTTSENITYLGKSRVYSIFLADENKQNMTIAERGVFYDRILSATQRFVNLTVLHGEILAYHSNTWTGGYGFENINLVNSHTGTYDITYSAQNNTPTAPYKILNMNCQRANNQKVARTQGSAYNWNNIEFYRSRNILIEDEAGNPIENVTIKISNANYSYEFLTNSSGYGYQEMIEQISTPIVGTFNKTNTIEFDWTLEVSKTGYETITGVYNILVDIPESVILKTVNKIRQTVNGDILQAIKPESGSRATLLEL